tara:strand:+ start:8130 stop:8360 length:231 start_codon:yes stop_codon:yes gene_type:complete
MTNLLNGSPLALVTGFGLSLLPMVGLTIVSLPINQMRKGRSRKVLTDDDMAVLFAEQPNISKCTADQGRCRKALAV